MINQQLIDYIQLQKSNNISEEEIKNKLIERGWDTSDVDEGFKSLLPASPIVTEEVKKELPVNSEPIMVEIPEETKKPPESNKPPVFFILIVIAVVAGLIISGVWYLFSRKITPKTSVISPTTESSPTSTPEETNNINTNIYSNTALRLKINYPKEWKSEENNSSGVIVNLYNPVADSDNGNRFATNINIVSENTGNLTVADYVKMSKKVLNESFTNYSSVSENNITVNSKAGTLIEATYEMGVYKLHNLQLFIVSEGKAYVITATTLNSMWNSYKDILNTALNSFELN